mgnify:CR=1 FL=1
MTEYMTTKELADFLRIKQRKVYDLAASGNIPCSRAMGKLLFPRAEIEANPANRIRDKVSQAVLIRLAQYEGHEEAAARARASTRASIEWVLVWATSLATCRWGTAIDRPSAMSMMRSAESLSRL